VKTTTSKRATVSHRRRRNASFSTYTNAVSSNCTAAPKLESQGNVYSAVRRSRTLLPAKPAICGTVVLVDYILEKYRTYEKERRRYSVEKAGSEKRLRNDQRSSEETRRWFGQSDDAFLLNERGKQEPQKQSKRD
jgi:hypothetical protein